MLYTTQCATKGDIELLKYLHERKYDWDEKRQKELQ